MDLIEKYREPKEGYHPFLIREGWQVAQLNYMDELEVGNIDKLDVHYHTDEVFIVLKGKAVLIGAELKEAIPDLKVELMRPNIVYNIPKGTWHNIAMTEGCEVIIVEKSNTHLSDFEFFTLSPEKKKELELLVQNAFEENH